MFLHTCKGKEKDDAKKLADSRKQSDPIMLLMFNTNFTEMVFLYHVNCVSHAEHKTFHGSLGGGLRK